MRKLTPNNGFFCYYTHLCLLNLTKILLKQVSLHRGSRIGSSAHKGSNVILLGTETQFRKFISNSKSVTFPKPDELPPCT